MAGAGQLPNPAPYTHLVTFRSPFVAELRCSTCALLTRIEPCGLTLCSTKTCGRLITHPTTATPVAAARLNVAPHIARTNVIGNECVSAQVAGHPLL